MDVEEWFRRRTFDGAAYDLEDLAGRKAAQELSVSVVMPAVNEGATIAGVVNAVMRLANTLVDEVVVLDGGSTDGTAELAARHGARVHTDAGVFPELGAALGKGDALWRSLAITSGDIVVFLDTDVRNPHPTFVSGLLGPLLCEPDVELAKAFYDRPVEIDGVMHPSGGGRVTELVARPLINLFWPELAGLVQPLSGEFAGRRSLLEGIPFFTGYGVELGMLIDTLHERGADAIAQVDLRRRVHRNHSLDALSRMAFGVLQTAMRRLPDSEAHRVAHLYRQFERGPDGVVHLQPPLDIEVVERPPMRPPR